MCYYQKGKFAEKSVLLLWILFCFCLHSGIADGKKEINEISTGSLPVITPKAISNEPEPTTALRPNLKWIKKDGVKMIWMYVKLVSDPLPHFKKLKNAGFNVILGHYAGRYDREDFKKRATKWAKAAKLADIVLLIDRQYGSAHKNPYRKYRSYSGKAKRTCCPLDVEYIKRRYLVSLEDCLAISQNEGCRIDGFGLDFEMYGSDSTRYAGPCVCDVCFKKYLDAFCNSPEKLFTILSPNKRGAYLKGNDLLAHYALFFEKRVETFYKGVVSKAHRINPDFLFAYTPEFRFLPGLSKGFGTPNMPSLCMSEKEYRKGVTKQTYLTSKIVASEYPTIYMPGFWTNKYSGSDLRKHILTAMTISNAWWLWSYIPIRTNNRTVGATHSLYPGMSTDDYFKLFTEVHDRIKNGYDKKSILRNLDKKRKKKKIPKKIPGKIIIDGKLDDASWKNNFSTPLFLRRTNKKATLQTQAKLTWDSKKLYIAVECQKPEKYQNKVSHHGRDNANLWKCDSIEIFIDANQDLLSYIQLVITADGSLLDSKHTPAGGDEGWDMNLDYKVLQAKRGWVVEMAIPWEALGIKAKNGIRFALNIYRNDYLNNEHLCWSPTLGGGFHSPEFFMMAELSE